MKKRLVLLAGATLFLSGCLDGSSASSSSHSTTTQKYEPLEQEKLLTGLHGKDTNHNGIRDDIDELIAFKYSKNPMFKKAAEQNARSIQTMMEARTREEALKAASESKRAFACAKQQFPKPHTAAQQQLIIEMSTEIESLTTNTSERLSTYEAANRWIKDEYIEPSSKPACDA